MARPYSEDLRERIVRMVEGGASRRCTAAHFGVSVSCVIKLMQRWGATGSVAPGQMGGWKKHALAGHEPLVEALVAAGCDLTLDELQEALAQNGVAVGRSSVWRFLLARALTLKKSRSTPPSRRGPTSPPPAAPGVPPSPG